MLDLKQVKINQGKILPFWFKLSETLSQTVISAESSQIITEDDKIINETTTISTGEKVQLSPEELYDLKFEPRSFQFTSSNPSVIDVDQEGVVYQVAPEQTGSATITVTQIEGEISVKRTEEIALNLSGGSVVKLIQAGTIGSAREAFTNSIDNSILSGSPETRKSLYLIQDHSGLSYQRNANFFLQSTHAEALTCISPWNSFSGKYRAGVWITPRHAVLAYHFSYPIGTIVRAITSNNQIIDRTVVQAERLFLNGVGTDVWMVRFDEDVPSSITPCKLFPQGYETYMPSATYSNAGERIPVLSLDQNENGIVKDFSRTVLTSRGYIAHIQHPELSDRLDFTEPIKLLDSGNPTFFVNDSELWLLTTFHGPSSGPFYGSMESELNNLITEIDAREGQMTGHVVQMGDLSAFSNYS